MTLDEAITYGEEQLEVFGGEHAEFINMAIRALEMQKKLAAFRGMDICEWAEDYDYEENIMAIESLLNEPVRCKDCSKFDDCRISHRNKQERRCDMGMRFIINGLKYETDNMEEIATVKKWYRITNALVNAIYGGQDVGHDYICTLWKSKNGNWLLTHEDDYINKGEAIEEDEAKQLLMQYAPDKYEELFEEIPEA